MRGLSRVFAIAEPVFALVLWLDPTAGLAQVVFSLVGWALHLGVALTVGRRWRVSRWTSTAYLLAMGAQITAKVATSTAVDTEGFWEYLVVAGFAGVLLSARGVAVVLTLCGGAYVMAGSLAEGITLPVTAIRLIALVAMGTALRQLANRVEQSVTDAERARAVAEGQARLLSSAYQDELQTVQHLRELDEMKDDFITTVSHELRTPLTVILGLSDTVARNWDRLEPEQSRELLERMLSNARALDGIIASLLDVSRLERGVVDPELEAIELAALGRSVTARLEPLLRDHDVHVLVPTPVVAKGDARLIERVIENLLTNAARHTPAGTRVEFRAIERPGTVEVVVADQGPGLDPDIVSRLGERFLRGRPVTERSRVGLGIGLALVTEVLALHDTALEVGRTPGGGATFSFRLPLAGRGDRDGSSDGDRAPEEEHAVERG